MRDVIQHHNAIVGFPLEHSLSPSLHNAIYQAEKINAEMTAYAREDIKELITLIREKPLELIAVTIPHKQTIMRFLEKIDPTAEIIGAVNTVINHEGILTGYNTDVIGVSRALAGIPFRNKNVLIIGAGGVAQAVGYYVRKQAGNIFCLNRSRDHAETFIKKCGGQIIETPVVGSKRFDIIINTTPIGMSPDKDKSPLENFSFTSDQTVFDCIYNPLETKLLREAKAAGATTISGLTMFVAQGLAQEELWLNREIKNNNYEAFLKNTL